MIYLTKKFLLAVFFVLLVLTVAYYLNNPYNSNYINKSTDSVKLQSQTQVDNSEPNLYSVLSDMEGISSFKKYVDMLQIKDVLSESSQYTIFIPSDEAFNSWPKEIVASLENDKSMLDKLVSYHIAIGKYNLGEMMPLTSLKTLNGKDVNITKRDGKIYIDGYAVMIKTNIQAKNGVIHVIDKVLMP